MPPGSNPSATPSGEATLLPLATMSLEVRPPIVIEPVSDGARWIVEAKSGRLEGERLGGTITGHANADWFLISPDRVGTVDARLLVETEDGATILLEYNGRVDLSRGRDAPIYIAPRFETGHEGYRWLNSIQAVGKGHFVDRTTLVYELYQVA